MNTENQNYSSKTPSSQGGVIHWVESSERLPPEGKTVLCYTGHGMTDNSWLGLTDQDDKWFKKRFTHWTEDVSPPCV